MRGRRACIGCCCCAQIAVGGAEDFLRLVEVLYEQCIGFVLMPFQTALLAVNPDVEIVLLPDANLGAMKHALGPAFEAQKHIRVVV